MGLDGGMEGHMGLQADFDGEVLLDEVLTATLVRWGLGHSGHSVEATGGSHFLTQCQLQSIRMR